jgi:hypothetical protein
MRMEKLFFKANETASAGSVFPGQKVEARKLKRREERKIV